MKVYTVTYRANDWTKDESRQEVVAANVVKAAQEIGKSKYTRYSGYVVSVVEYLSSVVIAK